MCVAYEKVASWHPFFGVCLVITDNNSFCGRRGGIICFIASIGGIAGQIVDGNPVGRNIWLIVAVGSINFGYFVMRKLLLIGILFCGVCLVISGNDTSRAGGDALFDSLQALVVVSFDRLLIM